MIFDKKKPWNKKAITALMVTLLLVSFAVAVGVGVMNFGSAQVEDTAECATEIGLKFSVVSGVEQVCYDAAKKDFSFTVENGAKINVKGIVVNVIGATKAQSFDLTDAEITKGGVYLGHVNYDSAVNGEIKQLKIVPKVVPFDQEEVCTEQAIVLESVKNC